jgi:excisionase family DNA binding protein
MAVLPHYREKLMINEITESKHWLIPKFYTVKETAVVLNVADRTVRRFLARGILRSSKATRKKLIPRTDIDSFFERTQ